MVEKALEQFQPNRLRVCTDEPVEAVLDLRLVNPALRLVGNLDRDLLLQHEVHA